MQPSGRQPGGRLPPGRQPGDISVAISGSLGESQLVAGGEVITATLTGDTYLAAGTGPVGSIANTQVLIDGIVSAQGEINGWNAQRFNIAVTDITRASDSLVMLLLPALSSFEITADEALTWTVPAQAVTGALSIVGSPAVGILNEAPKMAVVSVIYSTTFRKHAITANSRNINIS